MSNKNILIIIVIVVILILGILIWNLNWKIKPLSRPPATSQPAVPTTINTSTESIKIQFKPISTQTTSSELSVISSPRVFCEYFKIEGCVKNKSQIDIDREKEAIGIIEASEDKLPFTVFQKDLLVSDKRYQVLQLGGSDGVVAVVIVDIFNKKVSDVFIISDKLIKIYSDRFVFIDEIYDKKTNEKISEVLKQYKFGSEKPTVIPNSEIKPPFTYYCCHMYMVSEFKVISSTTKTITLGVYDAREILKQEAEYIEYKQVGTKTIKLPD
jgi:hypothetical protein